MLKFAIMILAAVGMVFGMVKAKEGAEWGKPMTIVCALVALLMAVVSMFHGSGLSKKELERIRHRELTFEAVSMEKLGLYLADKFPGKTAVVIKTIDFGVEDPRYDAQMKGLRKGLGSQITITDVVSPEIPEEYKRYMEAMPEGEEENYAAMGPMMMDGMLMASQFNKVVSGLPQDTDIIISLIGLPMDLENMTLWKMAKPPKLAVAGGMPMPQMRPAIREGFIVGMLTYRPDPDMTVKDVPKDLNEAFDKRYLLLTPESIEKLSADYPGLFPEM